MNELDGLLLVDKPPGPTSHDVVALVRRALGGPRVGHTGTLDPMATGLLALVVGRATRLARFVPAAPKRYEGRIRLGMTTDSDDVTGNVLSRHSKPLPTEEAVRRAAEALKGRFLQRPPDVSARSVGGTRMYRLARRGLPVEGPPKAVEVFRFDLRPSGEGRWAFEAEVSSGTYIRSLARDLGTALECGGVLEALRRTAIGPLRVDQALCLPPEPSAQSIGGAVIPLASLPLACGSVILPGDDAGRFRRGIPAPLGSSEAVEGEERAARDASGRILGVGVVRSGRLHPVVVLAPKAPG